MTMAPTPRVTIHMAASLDGFIARRDGRVDWLETADRFEGGATMSPEYVASFLKTIDCYVMGSRTYELAREFEAKGMGWAYGDKPIIVLTHRTLPTRASVELYAGDLRRGVSHPQIDEQSAFAVVLQPRQDLARADYLSWPAGIAG